MVSEVKRLQNHDETVGLEDIGGFAKGFNDIGGLVTDVLSQVASAGNDGHPLGAASLCNINRVSAVLKELVEVILATGCDGGVGPVDVIDNEDTHGDANIAHDLSEFLLIGSRTTPHPVIFPRGEPFICRKPKLILIGLGMVREHAEMRSVAELEFMLLRGGFGSHDRRGNHT